MNRWGAMTLRESDSGAEISRGIGRSVLPGSSRLNNFDLLRIVAAAGVLISHSFALVGDSEPNIGGLTLGEVSILVFFGISGFLITQSWIYEPKLGTYGIKRVLRIYPALLAVLLLTTFGLGLIVTSASPVTYLTDPQTWLYPIKNIVMRPEYDLPGVFADNPFPNSVNGSLWTLTHEVRAYLLVAAFGLIGLYSRRPLLFAAWALVLVAALIAPKGSLIIGDGLLLGAFAVGSALLVLRDSVPWKGWIAVALLAAWLVSASASATAGDMLACLAIPYAAVLFAYRSPVSWSRLTNYGDFSYGLYLWAFPVQQVLVLVWLDISAWAMVAASLAATLPIAVGSWMLVERRALVVKARLSSRREEAVADTPTAPVHAT